MAVSRETPHYGGQMGLVALLCMLCATGCVALTDSSGSMSFLPSWSQNSVERPAVVTSQAIPVRAPAATFIVRFNDEPELTTVYRNFRRDEAATRVAFQKWAAKHAQLEGLMLIRASYSGELVLGLPQNDPIGRSPRDVIASLETMDNVAYVEIDSIARASEEK